MFRTAARRRAFGTAIFAILVGGLSYLVAVQSETGQRAEAAALETVAINYNPGFPLALVSPTFILIVMACIALLGTIRWGFQRGVVVLVAGVMAILLSQLLKRSVLERPSFWDVYADNTFPSGHVAVFAVIAFALIAASPAMLRGIMSVLGAVMLSGVVAQILNAGWHRPSDVFGAIMLALASYALLFWLLPPNHATGGLVQTISSVVLNIALLISLVLAGYHAVIALTTGSNSAAFQTGLMLGIGASCFGCNAVAKIARLGQR